MSFFKPVSKLGGTFGLDGGQDTFLLTIHVSTTDFQGDVGGHWGGHQERYSEHGFAVT